jgi:hypothetical protein
VRAASGISRSGTRHVLRPRRGYRCPSRPTRIFGFAEAVHEQWLTHRSSTVLGESIDPVGVKIQLLLAASANSGNRIGANTGTAGSL